MQPISKIKPHELDTFHGQRSKLRSFITSLRIYISLNSGKFNTDRSKVLFACSFLRDATFSWIESLLRDSFDSNSEDEEDEILDSFENFLRHFQQTFGDIDTVANAERQIKILRQKTSISQYATEFQQITSHLSWNEEAPCYQFYQGLKESIKDELSRSPRPSTVEELVKVSVRIDNRLFERGMERINSFPQQKSTPFQSSQF